MIKGISSKVKNIWIYYLFQVSSSVSRDKTASDPIELAGLFEGDIVTTPTRFGNQSKGNETEDADEVRFFLLELLVCNMAEWNAKPHISFAFIASGWQRGARWDTSLAEWNHPISNFTVLRYLGLQKEWLTITNWLQAFILYYYFILLMLNILKHRLWKSSTDCQSNARVPQ